MKNIRLLGLGALCVAFTLAGALQLRAGDGDASLQDVDNLLKQAAGTLDSPTPPDQQKQELAQAMKDLERLPRVYHGRLAATKRQLEAVIDELSSAEPGKIHADILDVDDSVRSLM